MVQLFTAVSAAQATAEKTKTLNDKKTIQVGGQKKQGPPLPTTFSFVCSSISCFFLFLSVFSLV